MLVSTPYGRYTQQIFICYSRKETNKNMMLLDMVSLSEDKNACMIGTLSSSHVKVYLFMT